MFKLNNVTRKFRNADNGSNQGGFGAATTNPFASAGTNVFDQMNKNAGGTEQAGMPAPNMNNGMPAGTNPPPLASMTPPQAAPNSQWSPQQPQSPQSPEAPQGGSPLDMYNKPSDNSTTDTPAKPDAATPKSLFDTDLKGWEGVTSKVDLGAGIEPEQVQLALSGTPESATAFMNIIQQVARTAMTQSAFMATKVAGQGVNNSIDSFSQTVPNLITDHQFSGMWQGDKVMSHESSKPMIDALTNSFRQQHPQATVQEIQEQVKHYMTTFSEQFNGQQAPKQEDTNTPKGAMSLGDFFS